MADASASLSSEHGNPDADKTSHSEDSKATVDKLLHEATVAADSAKTALEHMNDPPQGEKMSMPLVICSCTLPITQAGEYF